jgi:hypothetical protein
MIVGDFLKYSMQEKKAICKRTSVLERGLPGGQEATDTRPLWEPGRKEENKT